MSDPRPLGDLQLAILRELWTRREATAAEVHTALHPERGLAPTTIATMLTKMEKKGLVTHRVEGRQFVFRARVAQDDINRSMVREFVDRLFQGDSAALVNHLLTEGEIDPAELGEIKQKLADRRRADAEANDE